MATIDDLSKLDIRVVKITSAEAVIDSDKLLKLQVDIGVEERQILAGIGKSYKPEELLGMKIVAIVNLEPRTIMGLESQGMILATGDDLENISVLIPFREVVEGGKIK